MADRPDTSATNNSSPDPSADAEEKESNSTKEKLSGDIKANANVSAAEPSAKNMIATAATAAASAASVAAVVEKPFVGVKATTKISESLGWKVYHDEPKPWTAEEKAKYFADMETHPLFMDKEDVTEATTKVCEYVHALCFKMYIKSNAATLDRNFVKTMHSRASVPCIGKRDAGRDQGFT